MIHGDFETRSLINLVKTGAYVYAAHPSTKPNCLGWALDEDDPQLWMPGDPVPKELVERIKQGDYFAAWNAQFERLIWNACMPYYGFPVIPLEQFYCIAALSRARGYPGKLENAARFAGLPLQKDMEGHYLMLKLCKPRFHDEGSEPIWWDDPRDYERLGEYCLQDVKVERALFHQFIPFTDQELADYHLSETINDRGINVDLDLAKAAVTGCEKEKIDANVAIKSLTGGRVETFNQVEKILDWVKDEWKELPNLAKATVIDELAEDDIPPHVADVLEIRLENARAAVGKYDAILHRELDGIVRGAFMFRGAGQTGRFSSVGLQVHNLISETNLEAIPILKKYGVAGLRMLGDPVKILAQMVRPTFIAPPGHTFLIGDFSQIEARIAAWLAGEEQLLSVFRQGISPYAAFGTEVLGHPVTKHDTPKEYKVAKACILGLGFGGAEGALARSLKKEQIVLPHSDLTTFVQAYRGKYSKIKQYWYALNAAVLNAMYSVGTMIDIGPVSWLFDGEHLWCRLPSGRLMCYPFAEIRCDEWGDYVQYRRGNRSPKRGETEWPTVKMWHGLEIENLCQAIAFDLMWGAQRRLKKWDVRLHVHDEIVPVVKIEEAETRMPIFLDIMCAGESWSGGIPIAAEGEISERYRK